MECDSAHAKIEKKLKKTSIYVPQDYVDIYITTKSRKTVSVNNVRREYPVEAVYLQHDFFLNFPNKTQLRFRSIRPGTKVHDPTVTSLRSLVYLPCGKIKFKIDFNDEKNYSVRSK